MPLPLFFPESLRIDFFGVSRSIIVSCIDFFVLLAFSFFVSQSFSITASQLKDQNHRRKKAAAGFSILIN